MECLQANWAVLALFGACLWAFRTFAGSQKDPLGLSKLSNAYFSFFIGFKVDDFLKYRWDLSILTGAYPVSLNAGFLKPSSL